MVIALPKRDETRRVHRSTASWLLDRRHIQQLQVVNECLVLNGGKWCGHPGDVTIRHDLQWANSIIPCHPAQFSASVVLADSPPPLYSPPTLLPGPPSSTSCWSTAGQNRPHPTEVAEVLAHETERQVRLEEVSRHRQLTECAQGSRAVSRAVASAAAADPSAAGCGDAQRHQMAAADALLSMAAAEQQVVHHSTVDSPATPNQELNQEPPCVPNTPPITAPPSLQHAPAVLPCLWNAPPGALQHRFQTLVMCNFTPRRPRELPTSRWVSLNTLYRLFEPHNRGEVWLKGPGNLKQLITKWYKDHPAFAGLAVEQWCRRFTRDEARAGVTVFKFCFEHKMPHEAATI